MNPNALARSYSLLSPEERFRLILAAGGRDDQSEQRRLIGAGKRVELSVQDHAPLAFAFEQTAMHVYLELVELAARYMEALTLSTAEDDARGADDVDTDADVDDGEGDRISPEPFSAFDLALAIGFQLKVTADGWKLFCKTTYVTPFAMWEHLPGFSRLQNALALAEMASFTAEGFVRWRNTSRPGRPPLVRPLLSAESVAKDIEQAFRKAAGWWSGEDSLAVHPSP